MELSDEDYNRIVSAGEPMDSAIYDFVFKLYLDGAFAASEAEKNRIARKLMAYLEQRSRKELIFLVCDLLDQNSAAQINEITLRKKLGERDGSEATGR